MPPKNDADFGGDLLGYLRAGVALFLGEPRGWGDGDRRDSAGAGMGDNVLVDRRVSRHGAPHPGRRFRSGTFVTGAAKYRCIYMHIYFNLYISTYILTYIYIYFNFRSV